MGTTKPDSLIMDSNHWHNIFAKHIDTDLWVRIWDRTLARGCWSHYRLGQSMRHMK